MSLSVTHVRWQGRGRSKGIALLLLFLLATLAFETTAVAHSVEVFGEGEERVFCRAGIHGGGRTHGRLAVLGTEGAQEMVGARHPPRFDVSPVGKPQRRTGGTLAGLEI